MSASERSDKTTGPVRRRGLRRWLYRAALLVVLLVAAVVLRFAYASPYRPPENAQRFLAAAGGPPGATRDAYPLFQQCSDEVHRLINDLVPEAERERFDPDLVYDPRASDPQGETERMRQKALDVAAAVQASRVPQWLDDIRACDCYRRPPGQGAIYTWNRYDVGSMRLQARIDRCWMVQTAAGGDWPRYVHAGASTLALARLSMGAGTLIDAYCGVAMREFVLTEIRFTLLERRVPRDTLDALADLLDRESLSSDQFLRALEGERLQLLDLLDSVHTRGGTILLSRVNDLAETPDFLGIPARRVRWINFVGLFLPGRSESYALVNRVFDEYRGILATPAFQRTDQRRALRNASAEVPRTFLALAIAMPNTKKTVAVFDAQASSTAATRVMIALALYREAHGEFPGSLSDLSGVETGDPLTGQPFGYRRAEAGSAPYLLYSFGRDGVDNGGAGHKSVAADNMSFGDPDDSGADVVYTRER